MIEGGVFENKENSDFMGFMYFFKIVLGIIKNSKVLSWKFKLFLVEIRTKIKCCAG